jgi:fumarylacetoacetase
MAALKSWINVSPDSHFPIQNLPYGIFSVSSNGTELSARHGIAIGDFVLDLYALHCAGLLGSLPFATHIFGQDTMNAFMGLTKTCWDSLRSLVRNLLQDGGDPRLSDDAELKMKSLIPLSAITMHMPCTIGDYTG